MYRGRMKRRRVVEEYEVANELTSDVRRATTWSIVVSALMMAAGLLAISVPVIAGFAITAVVG
jgi:uncharacterized membrane protein HdeD (DUF308 family)